MPPRVLVDELNVLLERMRSLEPTFENVRSLYHLWRESDTLLIQAAVNVDADLEKISFGSPHSILKIPPGFDAIQIIGNPLQVHVSAFHALLGNILILRARWGLF